MAKKNSIQITSINTSKKPVRKDRSKKPKMAIPKPTAFDNFSKAVFGGLFEKYVNTSNMDVTLQKAKMPITAEEYLARGTMGAVIFAIVSFAVVNLFSIRFAGYTYLFFAFWFLAVILFLAFMGEYPNSVATSRKKKIDAVLPLAMGYIATMASADMPVENIIYELSKSKEYTELSREAQGISVSTRLFGKDIITAIKDGATYTPSPRFSEFLQGIITTMTSGGDLKEYFKQKALQYQTELSTLIKRNTESLSVLAESYIIVGVMFPLILMVIIGTVTSVIPGEGSLTIVVLYLIVGLIIPIIAVMFALILSSTIGEVDV
ncbi:type II secretion system F family protein [Cuniculiplasma sp. SKW4]|uniref:type II secretion system F family protein n=1 Tax=Cuniculiplasma sp. SKW4 TaxID=3400171 RepID=UPI003FCF72B9